VIEGEKDDVGYTGHKFDTDIGLSYMQARYYDPVIGRFYSNDPVGAATFLSGGNIHGFNRYAYANNNPYKYIDPNGKSCESSDGKTKCKPEGDGEGLPEVEFDTPEDWPSSMNDSDWAHHTYIYITPGGGKSDSSLQTSVAKDPTPGDDKPAMAGGTPNNASPNDWRGSISDSPVKTFTDVVDGNLWTINVTQPGHLLHPGFVMRGAIGGSVVSYGEGTGALQAFGPISKVAINDVWINQNSANVKNAN
jgi:RHS repeat-associated protein